VSEILGRNMVKGVIIKGVDDEILEMDLRQMINQFIYNNPEKPIERVREVLENVMSSANKELDFELSEDKNNIRLEVNQKVKVAR